MIDFNEGTEDFISVYSGSDRKRAVIYNGERYMLKYAEKRSRINEIDTSNVNNAISEHIACLVAQEIGYDVQETVLGTFNDEIVVGCKNFLRNNEMLHEFSWYLRKEYDSADLGRVPKLEQMEYVFENDEQLSLIKEEAERAYWEIFVLDALIGNFDRHSGNWGYVINADTGSIKPSPVYDCGSSLYPALSEAGMIEVLKDKEEIEKRIYTFPTAALSVGAVKKISYYDMLSSGYNEYCSEALVKLADQINIEKIIEVIMGVNEISDIRKEFYTTMLKERKEKIIDKIYKEIKEENYNQTALNKISGESPPDQAAFVEEEIIYDIDISDDKRKPKEESNGVR